MVLDLDLPTPFNLNIPNPLGLSLPMPLQDLPTNAFNSFAEYLYGNNMIEQQDWEPDTYYLSSLNFGGLEDTSSFQVC